MKKPTYRVEPVRASTRARVGNVNPTREAITGDHIRLRVTQEVIDVAEPMSVTRCILALALIYRGATSVVVTDETIRFNLPHLQERRVYLTPAVLAVQVEEFDVIAEKKGVTAARAAIRPFSFDLENPFKSRIAERPTNRRGPDKKPRKRKQSGVRFCSRRSRGLRVIEVQS